MDEGNKGKVEDEFGKVKEESLRCAGKRALRYLSSSRPSLLWKKGGKNLCGFLVVWVMGGFKVFPPLRLTAFCSA